MSALVLICYLDEEGVLDHDGYVFGVVGEVGVHNNHELPFA